MVYIEWLSNQESKNKKLSRKNLDSVEGDMWVKNHNSQENVGQ